MAVRRIRRQEMKHDEFVDFFSKTTMLIEKKWRLIVPVIAGLLGIAIIVVAAVVWTRYSQRKAEQEFARAQALLQAPVLAQGARPSDPATPSFPSDRARLEAALQALDRVASERGGKVGWRARMLRGLTLLRLSRGAEAEPVLQEVLPGATDAMTRGLIRHALASAALQRGDLTTAEQRLRELEAGEAGYPKDVVLYDLSNVLRQEGKAEEAVRLLQRLMKEFPDSPVASEARSALGPPG